MSLGTAYERFKQIKSDEDKAWIDHRDRGIRVGTPCHWSSGGVIVAIEGDENGTNMELKVQLQSDSSRRHTCTSVWVA